MKTKNFAAVVLLALTLQGCAAAALTVVGTGLGVGAGAGVEHTMNGIVYKTFEASLNELRFATLKMFDHLGMPVTADQKTDEGWTLTATASDRTIDVTLERVTDKMTRMRDRFGGTVVPRRDGRAEERRLTVPDGRKAPYADRSRAEHGGDDGAVESRQHPRRLHRDRGLGSVRAPAGGRRRRGAGAHRRRRPGPASASTLNLGPTSVS